MQIDFTDPQSILVALLLKLCLTLMGRELILAQIHNGLCCIKAIVSNEKYYL